MLDDVRNIDTTYRIMTDDRTPGYYDVTIYPPKWNHGESKVTCSMYREDMLPKWMHDTMKLLDVAGSDVDVWTVGLRSDLPNGRVYWFSSKQHEELLRNAEGTTQGTCPP